MKLRHWLISVGLVFLVAVTTPAQKVAVGFDRTADFSKFKTYSWTTGVPAKNPQIAQDITTAIEQQLNSKGWRRVDDNADVTVSYHVAVVDDFNQATVARPGTWGPQAGSMEQVWRVVRGALIVELKDGSSKSEVWRATATDTINEDGTKPTDFNKVSKKVKKAVEKMFKGFPPARAKT